MTKATCGAKCGHPVILQTMDESTLSLWVPQHAGKYTYQARSPGQVETEEKIAAPHPQIPVHLVQY